MGAFRTHLRSTARIPMVTVCSVLLLTGPARAQLWISEVQRLRVVTVARGLDHPWGIAFLPTGGLLVTERSGAIRLIPRGSSTSILVQGVPKVYAIGEGGLMDIALHPQFAENSLVYFTYTTGNVLRGATTALGRGRLAGARLEGVEELFAADAWSRAATHFGSRILFDGEGHLFMSVGDRDDRDAAQRLDTHQGKILRLTDRGQPAPGNPFATREGAKPEIWSLGHRNPQGLAWHPETGALWETEHGPRGGDEVNVIRAGANYGWPLATHGVDYDGSVITRDTALAGMESPLVVWVPSIAPSGMTFVTGAVYPRWAGNLMVAALAGSQLCRIVFEGTRATHQEAVLSNLGRIRLAAMGPDGYLYLLTDGAPNGRVLRIEPMA